MTTLSMDNNIDNLIAYGKEMEESGLTLGTGGNLSFYDRSQNIMYITP
jgi:ribulose-5-phosphate 4-epimerase/fuculose-1-phosphate aldolase